MASIRLVADMLVPMTMMRIDVPAAVGGAALR
jgi:hypothetical protein